MLFLMQAKSQAAGYTCSTNSTAVRLTAHCTCLLFGLFLHISFMVEHARTLWWCCRRLLAMNIGSTVRTTCSDAVLYSRAPLPCTYVIPCKHLVPK